MKAGLAVALGDAGLQQRVENGVAQVEQGLRDACDAPEEYIREAATHLLDAGGKRFRPMLAMLAADFGDPTRAEVAQSAVVVELTHLATLYHDDVMDEADKRRGAPTANARWDNALAVLVGDYLFAQVSSLVADLGPDMVRIQAETFGRLVRGQIRETIGPDETDDALAHYLDVVADKTGSLIATSARFGATMAGAPIEVSEALTEFGERIGVAFQLADDIIDIASATDESGKTPGTDLREGVPTLPTLIAQTSTDPADARLLQLLSGPIDSDAEVDEALRLMRAHSAMADARAYVQAEADAARALLSKVPDTPARQALDDVCDVVVTRLG